MHSAFVIDGQLQVQSGVGCCSLARSENAGSLNESKDAVSTNPKQTTVQGKSVPQRHLNTVAVARHSSIQATICS